jgi:hypothetical protein
MKATAMVDIMSPKLLEVRECVAFTFLGYTFQPRRAKNRWGKYFVSFLPARSTKAASAVRATIRDWRMAATRNNQSLEDLARRINPTARGASATSISTRETPRERDERRGSSFGTLRGQCMVPREVTT